MVIAYGFLGCSGGILFFNLFLERIITLLAVIMRFYHEREVRKSSGAQRRDSTASLDDGLDEWKPSVYWVMLCLLIGTIIIGISASLLYCHMENWSYSESIYFCFVAFSTIGFGDYVPSQREHYDDLVVYRFANFVCIVTGCCCIYSLFNVTSIVIKQFLNWLIKKLDCKCNCFKKKQSPVFTQVARTRRNALTPNHVKSYSQNSQKSVNVRASIAETQSDPDSMYDSDGEKEICMRDLLKSNKVSLAILQKELYESAQRGKYRSPAILLPSRVEEKDDFKKGAVGPLAIVNKALGEDERI
ncbi:potassium channel subfamily K member 12-like protein [Leptotrombidium deliense]|uniref:Potassium channel subfamily K member 12-like protein n=1 Tax=Leptotrombidium deliense TaxID=299467 RepID=A0A443S5U6_9ACAR|nr:potassium channel subfamily K member 12-like protein [Leptotrombidium deliense]